MKNILSIMVILLGFGFSFAQNKPIVNDKASKHKNINFEKWSQELDLSEAQKKQILDIKSKYNSDITALRTSGTLDEQQAQSLFEKQESDVKKVLTTSQLEKSNLIELRKSKERNKSSVPNSTNK